MAVDPVASSALYVVDNGKQPGIRDVRRPPAARTDHVVVMAGLAGDVGVLAAGQVDPFDGPQLDEDLEGPEHGRPTYPQSASLGLREKLCGGEVAVAGSDEVGDGAARPGQPIAGGAQGEFG